MWWMLFKWSGAAGAAPVQRLYLPGDFGRQGALLVLDRLAPTPAGGRCFRVTGGGAEKTACGVGARLWVGDALLEVMVAEGGTPRVSVAGVRPALDEWIGSDAGGGVRFPLRGYGIPARAGRVVGCTARAEGMAGGGARPVGCFEVHDWLGRVALARADGTVPDSGTRLRPGRVYALRTGDELWLGMVPFRVERGGEGGAAARLALARIGSTRPEPGLAVRGAAGGGGDRRWLGRLWAVEGPDPADSAQARYEVLPLRERYTAHNLSRQRTNFEGEDIVQRLVDAQLLCLETGPEGPRVAWRAVQRPGCGPGTPEVVAAPPDVADAYRRARGAGDAARVVRLLVERTNAALARGAYLDDPSTLPLAFEWELRRGAGGPGARGLSPDQPAPRRLWGVRFGATRVLRQDARAAPPGLPGVYLRAGTSPSVIEVLGAGDTVAASFHLAGRGAPGNAPREGALCLGGALRGSTRRLDGASGSHQPLGTVAFGADPLQGDWSADPRAGCGGCRLEFRERVGGGVELRPSATCDGALRVERPAGPGRVHLLRDGDRFSWGAGAPVRLRYVDRGARAWAAVTEPRTGRRGFLEEFHGRGGLAPLLGDASRYGVEAAVREYAADRAAVPPLELSIDGDLQIAVQSIVDQAASSVRAAPGRTPVTVAVLDARTGELLAAAGGPRHAAAGGRATAWEAAAGVDGGVPESALLRRGAVGSTLKVAGLYALLNSPGLRPGPPVADDGHLGASERAPGGEAGVFVARQGAAALRRCSGPQRPHVLPLDDAGFTDSTVVQRFATSCNSFFVLTGFRHAGAAPMAVHPLRPGAAAPPEGELGMRRHGDSLVLVQPAGVPLADRVRQGLAEDFAPGRAGTAPRSLYGVLARSGFHFRGRSYQGADRAGVFSFTGPEGRTRVELADDWFSADGVPALVPGRDFVYPTLPSPAHLDERTLRAPAEEWFDGNPEAVRRTAADGGRSDVQYAMLLIGQSTLTGSALGLSVLYAPAARVDGRGVRPCLFISGCGEPRAGPPVLSPDAPEGGRVLNQALRAVLEPGGTAAAKLPPARRGELWGWGGKTGTYDVERAAWPEVALGREEEWRDLVAWACGVEGVGRPAFAQARGALGPAAARRAEDVLDAGPGGAAGARVCEDAAAPLNPGGIHRYRGGSAPAALDALARAVEDLAARETTQSAYHAMVLVALPSRGGIPRQATAAEGIVVSVLVDDTADLAVRIATQAAGAVERWAPFSRTPATPPPTSPPGGRR
jgi:cell division protein FtsI/penicillin-binding protein 2